jgi:hypothetical protein
MTKLLHKTFQGGTVPKILKLREIEAFDLRDKKEILNFDRWRQYVYYFKVDMNKGFENLATFRRNILPPSSGSKIKPTNRQSLNI